MLGQVRHEIVAGAGDPGERMPERLGLGLIPGTGWRASEVEDIARAAEDAGFEAAFCAEVDNDAVATALLMGLATRRLKVGTGTASTATGKQASPATATDLTINRIIN